MNFIRFFAPFIAGFCLLVSQQVAMANELNVPMIVHKDPYCGCCKVWADAMEEAGFAVAISPRQDLEAVKREQRIPQGFEGCHTATVAGYTLEGHVPLEAIKKLLMEKPDHVHGLAVAGMPLGSLGMGDGSTAAYDVHALNKDDSQSLYMRVENGVFIEPK